MLPKSPDCQGCVLETRGQGFARAEGSGANGVLLLGEKLGFYEARDGLPFRPFASAGNMLEVALDMNGFRRGQFRLFNARNCFLPSDDEDPQDDSGNAYRDESDWLLSALRHCNIHRTRVIEAMRPRVICALGSIALRATTGMAGKKLGVSHLRGYPIWSTEYECWVVPTYNPQHIQRGHKKLIPLLVEDLKKAVRLSEHILKHGSWAPRVIRAVEYPSEDQIRDFLARVSQLPQNDMCPLVFDIELTEDWSAIRSVQFSYDDEDEGMYFDWQSPHREAALTLLASPVLKAGHNVWHFDVPKLKQSGVVVNGVIEDSIWMWHHFQPDLTIEEFGKRDDKHVGISSRMSLQSMCSMFGMDFPWKHLDVSQPRFYGCVDAIATRRAFPRLKRRMLATGTHFAYGTHPAQVITLSEGVWTGYARYTRDFDPYLQIARDAGVPINTVRLSAFEAKLVELRKELALRLQQAFPHHLKGVYPPEGYAKPPSAADQVPCECCTSVEVLDKRGNVRTKYVPQETCSKCSGKGKRRAEPGEQPRLRTRLDDAGAIVGYDWWDADADEGACWRAMELRDFDLSTPVKEKCSCVILVGVSIKTGKSLKKPKPTPDASCEKCSGTGRVLVMQQERWCQVKPFTGSSQQLMRYIQERGYRIPENRKTHRPTTGQVQIEQLAREYDDMLFKDVVEYRTIDKLKDTYCVGWKPSSDGRLRAEINYATSIGQLAASNPNILAIPKNKDLAFEFQQCIEAPLGHMLREYDFKAFHVVTMGFISRDKKYLDLGRADPHSFLTAIAVGEPVQYSLLAEDRAEFMRRLKDIKKRFGHLRDSKYKHAFLGYGNGMRAKTLYERHRAFTNAQGQREGFESIEDAQAVLDLLDMEFEVACAFRKSIQIVAHNKKMLVSWFGFVRWFFEVFEKKFQGYHVRTGEPLFKTRPGEDAEDAIAFLLANVAHIHFRDTIMRLGAQGLLRKYGWFLPLHDALFFCCTDEQNEALNKDDVIKKEMEMPSSVLKDAEICPGGLSIAVDVKFGRNRAPYDVTRNPEGMRALEA